MSLVKRCAAATVLFLSAGALRGQEPEAARPISTDRPSESAGPGIVPRRALQLEMGYKLTRSEDSAGSRIDTQTLPDLLLRLGVFERLEARLTANGWSFKDSVSGREDGFNDVSLGLKWALLAKRTGALPTTSILAEVAVPVGDPEFTGEFVNPKILFLFQNSLSERLNLTTNFGVNVLRLAADQERKERTYVDLPYTALVAGSFSERWGWFAELFGAFALHGRRNRHSLQAGVTALVSRTLQLDARGGAGLVANVPTWIFGAGVALRIPH